MTDDRYGKIHTDGSRSGGQPLNDSTEARALALVNGICLEKGVIPYAKLPNIEASEALCRAIEQHETFKQEVSDIVQDYSDHVDGGYEWNKLMSLITKPKPKPDPLAYAMIEVGLIPFANQLRAELDALGFEIREKGQ